MPTISSLLKKGKKAARSGVSMLVAQSPAPIEQVIPKGLTTKNVPDSFVQRRRLMRCPACNQRAITHESDYPSNEAPFSVRRVLYCTACGLGFVPKAAQLLAEYYRVDYATENRNDRAVAPQTYFCEDHRARSRSLTRYWNRASRQLRLLQRYGASSDLSTAHVLDYGSGPGYFLHVTAAGHKFAFEPDELSHKYLEYLGAVRYAKLATIPEGLFDIVVASHSIEHLVAEELGPTLARLLKSLAPGGRLLIEVPAGGHAFLHLGNARQDPHTLFFTPEALWRAVNQACVQTGTQILLADAAGKTEIRRRKDPIYDPAQSAPPHIKFFNVARGSLTMICGRP